MSETNLLALLADGSSHSGEELGHALGVSRAAVWKQISKLDKLGLAIESSRSSGYRIPGGLSLLNTNIIRQQLSDESRLGLTALRLEQSITSTNALARELAEAGDVTGLAIIAEQQTAGRGRRGRQWISPYGRNIYLSLAWGFEGGVGAIEGLSLATGVAAKQALERCGVNDISLKWPNDLLSRKQKLGGILLEIVGDPAGFCQVIIGIGMNVDMRTGEGEQIDQAWTSVGQLTGGSVDRSRLAGCLLDELIRMASGFERAGFSAYREQWQASDAYANQPVQINTVSHQTRGIARGVSRTGALRLEVDGELKEFSGGEISVRGDHDS